MELTAYLYKVTNLLNSKAYIGITSNPKAREYQHFNAGRSSILSSAVELYGKESFSFEVICMGERSYIADLEKKAIELYSTITPSGYNIRPGGDNSHGGYSIPYKKTDEFVYAIGFWFPNTRTAIKALNINPKTFYRRRKEATLGDVLSFSSDNVIYLPQYVGGFWFDNLLTASDKLKVSTKSLKARLTRGFIEARSARPESKLAENNPMFGRTSKEHPNARAIRIFGTMYDSISDAVRSTEYTKSMIEKRLKKNIEGFEYIDPS